MRLIIVSDSHGSFAKLHAVFEREPEAECFLFLGDHKKELEDIRLLYPDKEIISVRGNCDTDSFAPLVVELFRNGKKILMTHGHTFDVKRTKDNLMALAKEQQADLVVYGHTHIADIFYQDMVYLVCPGSIGLPKDGAPSYAVIDFQGDQMIPVVKRITKW